MDIRSSLVIRIYFVSAQWSTICALLLSLSSFKLPLLVSDVYTRLFTSNLDSGVKLTLSLAAIDCMTLDQAVRIPWRASVPAWSG